MYICQDNFVYEGLWSLNVPKPARFLAVGDYYKCILNLIDLHTCTCIYGGGG